MNVKMVCETNVLQAVVQDVRTKQILRVGFVNDEAIAKMEETKTVYMLNDDQSGLEVITGGEYFKPIAVDSFVYNTDKSAVIIKALPEGSTTGADTFRGDKNIEDLAFLSYLQDFIEKRKREMPEGSYIKLLYSNFCDVRVSSLIPVKESLYVYCSALFKTAYKVVELFIATI